MDEIHRLAEPLQGKRVVHVSATAFGGGVAEINYTLVPLMADVGLDVEWRIIRGADEFFNVTKAIHNGLQGDPRSLTPEESEIFRRYNAENAAELPADDYDFVIVHDPQPVGDDRRVPARRPKWIWRGHIDFSTPNPDVFDVLLPSIRRYDAAIFHMREYVPHADGLPEVVHLAAGDRPADAEEHGALAGGRGVHRRPVRHRRRAAAADAGVALRSLEGPARRDRRLPAVKERVPGRAARARRLDGARRSGGLGLLQPHRRVRRGDPDIYILCNMNNVGAVEVNAFQVHSDARDPEVDQGGVRPDRHRGALEGQPDGRRPRRRHRRPDRGRRDRLARRLASTSAPQACLEVLRDPRRGAAARVRGKEHVRRHFLTPRLLRDWLVLFNRLAGNDTGGSTITVV